MADPISGAFRQPFREQVAALRLRLAVLVPTARWDDLQRAQHDRAFMVAGAVKADLLADLAKAVDRAVAEGAGFDAFKKDFRALVEKHGWHGWTGEGTAKGEAWRMRVIYRTNMATSYAAGRMAQLVDGKFKFWVYKHGGSLEPRLQHLAWDGVALPPDHPFWLAHYPPNDWGCSCRAFGARTEAGIKRVGGDPGKDLPDDWQTINPKTGAPVGIGKGWDHAPGGTVAEDIIRTLQAKVAALPASIGADLGSNMAPLVDAAWSNWVAETLSGGGRTKPGLAGVLPQEVVVALAKIDIKPASAEIVVDPGILSGPKALRHLKSENALSQEDWLSVPNGLRKPRAVLLDTKTGNLIFVIEQGASSPQLAVKMAYYVKRPDRKGMDLYNGVISAYRVTIANIEGRVKGKELVLLAGRL